MRMTGKKKKKKKKKRCKNYRLEIVPAFLLRSIYAPSSAHHNSAAAR